MGILTLLAASGGLCLAASEYEKNNLVIRPYTVINDKIPVAFDGARIALLADLHDKSFGKDNEILIRLLEALRPDYIFSAGDMILKTRPDVTTPVTRLLGRLERICPVYCGNGNHEMEWKKSTGTDRVSYERYICRLKDAGVTVLEDSTADITRDGMSIRVTGLDLDPAYYAKGLHVPMRSDYLPRRLGTPEPSVYNILLGHYPNYFREYADWGADMVLAGHMHGGTVRLPGLGGLMSPDFEFFPEYDRGMYELGDSTMVVSGGLGTHAVNIRLGGNYPEIPLITLHCSKSSEVSC